MSLYRPGKLDGLCQQGMKICYRPRPNFGKFFSQKARHPGVPIPNRRLNKRNACRSGTNESAMSMVRIGGLVACFALALVITCKSTAGGLAGGLVGSLLLLPVVTGVSAHSRPLPLPQAPWYSRGNESRRTIASGLA